MQIQTGQAAPDFEVQDIFGNPARQKVTGSHGFSDRTGSYSCKGLLWQRYLGSYAHTGNYGQLKEGD